MNAIADLEAELGRHPLYAGVRSLDDLRHFMERHVLCVWDFMSILKSLQRDLTRIDHPWIPLADTETTRFVNEIVLDEESDLRADGRVQSHFAWYLEAMDEVGCDTAPIRHFAEHLRRGLNPFESIRSCGLPEESVTFSIRTMQSLEAPLHVRAALFFHGREDVIPGMFIGLVKELQATGLSCASLLEYLERHIEADGEEHGPRALAILERLYDNSSEKRIEGESAALSALLERKALWNATLADLPSLRQTRHEPSVARN